MSRNRRKRPQLIKSTNGKYNGSTAVLEHPSTPVLIPLDNEIRPILEANRRTRNNRANRARNGMRAISQAWDDTEALGITADMRRSGPGMLSDQDRKDTLYKAYLNSVWISACVDVISKRITSGGYSIEYCGTNEKPTPEEEQQKEQLQAFVDYTNDDEDFLQLVRTIVADILIYGECYVEIVRQNGIPYSLHKIDCITMNYTLDPHGNIVKYIQNMYHSTQTIPFEPDDVIRFWLPSPNANKIALSPIERIMGSIDADVHMADWVRSFFRKGARPNFWIKFEGARDEANRFVSWLRENYTGMANAHVPLVLYDGATLNEIGKGSVDIDFLKGRELMCKEILAGYQVPPALVGLIESGNIGGGTGESQEKSFLRNACDPLRAMIFGQFNYRIAKKGFNTSSWRISTHYADYRDDTVVSQIQDRRMRNGTLNVNEIRRDMNRPPVDGGDVNVIVMSKELQPLDRIAELADEQRAQSQITSDQNAAKVELTKAQSEEIRAKIANTAQVTQQPQPDKTQSSQDEKAIGALERSINHVIDGNIRVIENIMATKSVSELSDDDQQRITDLMESIAKQDQLLQSMKAYDAALKENHLVFHTHEIDIEEIYGEEDLSQQETDSQSSKTDVLSERQNSDQSNEPVHKTSQDHERDSSDDDGAGSIPEDLRAELDRWEAQALDDVTTRGWHGFCTVIVPETLHTAISESLQACYTPDDVIDVFEQARMGHVFPRKVIEAQETHVSKDTLRQHVHEIFTEVAERGRKSLSEDEA